MTRLIYDIYKIFWIFFYAGHAVQQSENIWQHFQSMSVLSGSPVVFAKTAIPVLIGHRSLRGRSSPSGRVGKVAVFQCS